MGALALAALLAGCGGDRAHRKPVASVSARHVALVERRVERLRGLRFRRPVRVAVISPAKARQFGLQAARRMPSGAKRVEEELLQLVGLLPPGTTMDQLTAELYGEQVAGFYDPQSKRLALVRGMGVDDVTLAHELTHALEDQRLGGFRMAPKDTDAMAARKAVVEGSATEVMARYARRYPGSGPSLGAIAGQLLGGGGRRLSPYVRGSLRFPYVEGRRFVEALRSHGDIDWRMVDLAETSRPPVTTAEILNPGRWGHQRPVRIGPLVRPGALAGRGAGWAPTVASPFGAEDTLLLLLQGGVGPAPARRIALGWRGGRLELWRQGSWAAAGCRAPCRARDVLAIGWRTSGTAASRALDAALGRWLARTLHATPVAGTTGGYWRLPGGSAATTAVQGAAVRVVLAPSPALAGRLARRRAGASAPRTSP
jgi:hypothetical protein